MDYCLAQRVGAPCFTGNGEGVHWDDLLAAFQSPNASYMAHRRNRQRVSHQGRCDPVAIESPCRSCRTACRTGQQNPDRIIVCWRSRTPAARNQPEPPGAPPPPAGAGENSACAGRRYRRISLLGEELGSPPPPYRPPSWGVSNSSSFAAPSSFLAGYSANSTAGPLPAASARQWNCRSGAQPMQPILAAA